MKTSIGLLGILILLFALIIQPTSAVTASNVLAPAETIINVNTTTDENSDPGTGCSLREAILSANPPSSAVGGCVRSGSGAATVVIPAGIYTLTVTGTGENGGFIGDLDILTSMTISGADTQTTIIDGDDNDRVFDILAGYLATVNISNLTIRHGNSGYQNGGGIRNNANLVIDNVKVESNLSGGSGGGIYNESDAAPGSPPLSEPLGSVDSHNVFITPTILTLQNSRVTANQAAVSGGGIMNYEYSGMIIDHSIIDNNLGDSNHDVSGGCGGIENDSYEDFTMSYSLVADNLAGDGWGGGLCSGYSLSGEAIITDSIFSGNYATFPLHMGGNILHGSNGVLKVIRSEIKDGHADAGAGISSQSNTQVENVTFSMNIAGWAGGAIYVHSGNFTAVHTTIVDNEAPMGAGIYNLVTTVSVKSSLIARNTTSDLTPTNCGSITIASLGYNLSDDATCSLGGTDDKNSTDPKLGSYGQHGSINYTSTYALLSDSPAIDAADPLTYPALDQRGRWRPGDGNGDGIARSDIGAYEIQEMVFLPLVRK